MKEAEKALDSTKTADEMGKKKKKKKAAPKPLKVCDEQAKRDGEPCVDAAPAPLNISPLS